MLDSTLPLETLHWEPGNHLSQARRDCSLVTVIGHRDEDAGVCDQAFSPLPQALLLPQLRAELLVQAHITAYTFESKVYVVYVLALQLLL